MVLFMNKYLFLTFFYFFNSTLHSSHGSKISVMRESFFDLSSEIKYEAYSIEDLIVEGQFISEYIFYFSYKNTNYPDSAYRLKMQFRTIDNNAVATISIEPEKPDDFRTWNDSLRSKQIEAPIMRCAARYEVVDEGIKFGKFQYKSSSGEVKILPKNYDFFRHGLVVNRDKNGLFLQINHRYFSFIKFRKIKDI